MTPSSQSDTGKAPQFAIRLSHADDTHLADLAAEAGISRAKLAGSCSDRVHDWTRWSGMKPLGDGVGALHLTTDE